MLKVFFLLSVVLYTVHAQQATFCDISQIEGNASYPLPNLDQVYLVDIEKNKDGFTEEIKEYFDGKSNIARSSTLLLGNLINSYVYPKSEELIVVRSNTCLVTSLRANDKAVAKETTFDYIDRNGKKTVVGGTIGILNIAKELNPNLVIKYTGNMVNIRGIPVKQWVACLTDSDNTTPMKVTVSYSDPSDWTPAFKTPSKSVPVQVQIDRQINSKTTTEINSVLRYRIDDVIQEEDFYTEKGIYCPGRFNGKELPFEKKMFSFWLQQSIPTPNTLDLFGEVTLTRNEHDFDRKLYKAQYYENDVDMVDVRDFNTGLSYKINKDENSCEIFKLNPNDTVSIDQIFRFDEDPKFQYTGMRRVRGINTNVWIAPRTYKGKMTMWEWHFATDEWAIQESNGMSSNDPILLTISFGYDTSDITVPKTTEYFHIVNFDQSRSDLFDFDISVCNCACIDNKHIRFEIKPEQQVYEKMKIDQRAVKNSLLEATLKNSGVSLTRIGEFDIMFSNQTIFVTFTLYDKPKFYGFDYKEDTLEQSITKLNNSIRSDSFSIMYNGNVELVEKNSYVFLEKRQGRFIYESVETGETVNYTMGSVIAFLIVFVLIGMVAGFAMGYFLIIKRTEPLPELPGPLSFLNPNFSGQQSA